jgi:hypothetical protein
LRAFSAIFLVRLATRNLIIRFLVFATATATAWRTTTCYKRD